MASTAKEARQNLATLIEDADLGFEGGVYAYETRPGDAVAPYVTVFPDGATQDGAFYRLKLRLYTEARDDAQGAQDDLDDHAELIERVLEGQATYYPPGWRVAYLDAFDLFMAEWSLLCDKA